MANPERALIPIPREINLKEFFFQWNPVVSIITEPGINDDLFSAQTLCDACLDRKIPTPRITATTEISSHPDSPKILIGDPNFNFLLLEEMKKRNLQIPEEIGDEGYILDISHDMILIAANADAGVFYGVQTLIQMLPESENGKIPCVFIRDWTTLKHRGISLDFARGVVYKKDMIKENIERMGHYKMNFLILYLEDAFLFKSHPDIGENRDRLTPEECRELDEFAKKRHVHLVPALDSPGHMERLLRHPRYSYLREGEEHEWQKSVINVTHPDAYPLLKDLYNDLCDVFSSPYVYMGGDECFGLGKGRNMELLDKVGAALFIRHIKIIREILAERGKRMIIWADQFEPDFFKAFGIGNFGIKGLYQVPRDVIIAPWHYGKMEKFPFGKRLIEMKFDTHLWSSFSCHEIYPLMRSTAKNVETYIPFAHKHGALGAIHSSWKDWNSFNEFNWPQAIYFSEWAWTKDGRTMEELLPKAVESFYGKGTGELAKTFLLLGDIDHYFGWGVIGLEAPGFKLFFETMQPRELNSDILKLLKEFRKEHKKARKIFEKVRSKASRNTGHLDYVEFALDQQEILADLILCRHLMAKTDDASRKKFKTLLSDVYQGLRDTFERFQRLWLRGERVLGLENNKRNFLALIESLEKYLSS
ncbi:beta-N-acetylhexosaminidase [Candidatus Sumerlaeota bacterium]|nr:beta-N-acetylhexosaminidase [Candidatus Sumerlaeota bacterium]